MNALAGGGTFATLPALIALGLPANIANATSNVALLPGAGTSAWAFRKELAPVGGVPVWLLAAITFIFGLPGSLLLVLTPARTFDLLIPWLLSFAFFVMAFGKRASDWLHERVVIGQPTLLATQALLGIYGGYFGGGVGLITTALYGLLANIRPRELFAIRTTMLAVANFAAAFVFIGFAWSGGGLACQCLSARFWVDGLARSSAGGCRHAQSEHGPCLSLRRQPSCFSSGPMDRRPSACDFSGQACR